MKFLWVSHHKQLLGAHTEKELFLRPPSSSSNRLDRQKRFSSSSPTSVRDSACELNNGRLDIFLFHQFSLFFLFLLCFQNCFFLFFQPTVVVPLAPPSPSRPSFFSFLFYFFRCCLHGWPQSKSATNCGNTTHVIYENTILKAKNSRNRGVFFQKKRFLDIFYLGFPSWHIQYTMWQSRLRPFWWGWWGADCRQRGEKRSTRWVRCQVMS